MGRKKMLALFLVLIMLIPLIPVNSVYAEDVIGSNGSIPAGGQPGPGGISMVPSFRVGLISEEFNNPMDFERKSEIEDQVIEHYYNHMPKLQNSIIFSPYNPSVPSKSVWLPPDKALVGWYQSSSGDFRFIEDQVAMPYKHRRLLAGSANKREAPLFADELIEVAGSVETFSSLAGGEWEKIGNKVDPSDECEEIDGRVIHTNECYVVEESAKVWNYILEHWDGTGDTVDKNIKKFTRFKSYSDLLTDEEKLINRAGHVDLLMTLYYLSPPEQQEFYYREIERYIKSENQEKNPSFVAIDTVVRVSAPNYTKDPSQRIFVPSADYIMYAAGVTPENWFYNPLAPAFSELNSSVYEKDHTFKMMGSLIQKSIDQLPHRKRITDYRGDAYRNNAFAWGFGGVTGDKFLLTDRDYPDWRNSSVTNGIMESLIFHGDARGFVIGTMGIPEIYPSGGFEVMTNPAPEVNIDRYKPTIIGENVTVTIKGNLLGDEEDKWLYAMNNIEPEAGYPRIRINLTGSNATSVQADAGGTYPLTTNSNLKGNNAWITTTTDEIMSFLKGGTIIWNHATTDYPVEEDTNYEFKYTAGIEIQLESDEQIITLEGRPNNATKTFKVPPDDSDDYRRYTSQPVTYSEIKQGSPYNEDFEAMAGTPTTRDLYFAVGGSEYIVEIVTKYYEDQESERKYRSWYSGTSCEFKAGDTAPNKSVGGQSANMHGGGSYSKTWSGSIPNNATAVTALHSASCPAQPDYSSYNSDLAAANAFAAQVNGTVVTHTSSSDSKTRSFSSWGASVSPSKSPPTSTSASVSCEAKPAETDSEGNITSPAVPCKNEMATANPASAGSYNITVRWSNSAHVICGPCCTHELPIVEDRWTQKITYDIQKIEKVNVWKIDRGHVDGMTKLIDTDDVTAYVRQGDPNMFYNIAYDETSQAGRLRYSLEPEQHDNVVWHEGTRTNKCNGMGDNGSGMSPSGGGHNNEWADGILYTNDTYENIVNRHIDNSVLKDLTTVELEKFNDRRNMKNTATVISDFLILQSSSGDQSIIYFDKESDNMPSQENFAKVVNTIEEMWDNNSESAGHMSPDDINIGSYNGEFYNRTSKYEGTGDNHHTTTIFDNDPANTVIRPARPNDLRIYEDYLDIPDTTRNDEYVTGNAKVFYDNILSYGGASDAYSPTYDEDFNATGITWDAPYSSFHRKINDVVIHNPVSSQYAMVIPVDSSLDQRTPSTKAIGGNLQTDTQEYVTKLKDPHPSQNFIVNGDAEEIANDGSIINWKGVVPNDTGVTFTRRTSDPWRISGTGTFEIVVPSSSDRIAKYQTVTVGEPNTAYNFSGKIGAHRCEGYFQIEALDASKNVLQTWTSTKQINNATIETRTINFTTPANTSKLRVSIVNGNSSGSTTSGEYVFADDLVLNKVNGGTADWVPLSYTIEQKTSITNPDYVPEHTIPNPDYVAPINQPAEKIYSGSWTAQAAGTVKLNMYGAGGGYYQHHDHDKYYVGSQRKVGYVDVVPGDVISWNGNSVFKNGSVMATHYDRSVGSRSASSCGSASNSANSNSAYVITYGNGSRSWSSGGDASNYFEVPEVIIPDNGEPIMLTIPAAGEPTIETSTVITKTLAEVPEDWYETILVTIPANPNVSVPGNGTITAGNFLTLDYPFQIYFPNKGDFYGNGASGISDTTSYRGKGFVDDMDTTEWTAEKYVKFDYNVIYNGQLYPANYEIALNPSQEIFDFYLPLANKEAVSAGVEFYSIANNGRVLDNTSDTNKTRYSSKNARHSAFKKYNIDIVGRIGNLIMEDTGDFRFSNLFKDPVYPRQWFIENVIPSVELDQQREFLGPKRDIRGVTADFSTDYLNTYGSLDFLQQQPLKFTLSPSMNNIAALRKQPLRIGYPIFLDIQTIGNYYSNMQIIPYYYNLNLLTGDITPVDVYMKVKKEYQPINLHGAAVPGWDPTSVYNYQVKLNWNDEAARRNFHSEERYITEYVRDNTYNADSAGNEIPIGMPMGKYHSYGNAQIMYPNERNRTFIGTSNTYGYEKNPGGVLREYDYNQQAQRWHFTLQLPSSAIFVPRGASTTQSNIDSVMNNTSVVIATADIKAVGDTYVLQYSHPTGNENVTVAGMTHSLSSIPHSVIAVYSSEKSAANDLSTSGTH